MNIDALKDALRCAHIDERFVSLDGSARDESLVLEHDSVMGWTVYFSERGQRTGVRLQISVANSHPAMSGSGYGLQIQILNDADEAHYKL